MRYILISILIFTTTLSQFSRASSIGAPYFDLNYSLEFEDSLENPVLNIITDIKYDNLSFTKEDKSAYKANYFLKVFVKNTITDEIYEKYNRQIEITVDAYGKTNSRKVSSKVEQSMELKEGNFIILASLYDINSTKTFYRNKKVNVKSSNLKRLMINNFKVLSNKEKGLPFIVSYQRNFPDINGELKFDFIINKIQPEMVGESINVGFYVRNEYLKELVTNDSTIVINDRKSKRFSYIIDKSSLQGIEFEYLVKVTYKDDVLDESNGTFSYSWNKYPNNEEQMKAALAQMRYIMDEDTVEKYTEAPLVDSQRKFREFWINLSKSGSDIEATNLTREYFKRVARTNKMFKRFSFPGWKTDMGRIYIKFGEPDEIFAFKRTESQYAPPKKYVVWKYYSERKEFYFYDFDNFEDYRLTDESRMEEYQ